MEAAEVNTTGLFAVPFTNNFEPCVITITDLSAHKLFFTNDIIMPAGIVKVALFFTNNRPFTT